MWNDERVKKIDLPKSVCLSLSGLHLAVAAVDGQGWGAYLMLLTEGAPQSAWPGTGVEQGAVVVT